MNTVEAAAVANILRAALGEPVPDPTALLADARIVAQRLTAAGITERQREILALVAEGKTEAAIARELQLSRFTVKSHKAEILKALHARSAVHAVTIGFRKGLIR